MYFKKGLHSFEPGEVVLANVNYRPVRSPRGRRMFTRVTFSGYGNIVPDNSIPDSDDLAIQDDLNSKMSAVQDAFSLDFESISFHRNDDDVTIHELDNNAADNWTGNQLADFRWVDSPDEWIGTRNFKWSIYADLLDPYSGIVDYSDNVTKFGSGGPIKSWRNFPTGDPAGREVSEKSFQTIVHQGYAVALAGYVVPPSPLATGINYIEHLSKIGRRSPKKYSGTLKYAMYTTYWRYVYRFAADTTALPVII